MSELKNHTPFAANYFILPNIQGVDTLHVHVKASFNLGSRWTLCEPQTKPFFEDIYWGEPGVSSVKFSTDIHPGKPGTDIALIGKACAPDNKPVRQLDVTATLGTIQQSLRIFGERHWDRGRISQPSEFVQMPIRYEHAYGGQHWENEKLISLEQRNPVGKGYKGARPSNAMNGLALPNIENPGQLINNLDDVPVPAGFGFIAPNWHPRFLYAGTYDEQWQQTRAPYLPTDFQAGFHHSAHPNLISAQPLTGGEAVCITNMHPEGPIDFAVPQIALAGRAQFHGRPQETLQFALETLTIDTEARQLIMDWKASCLCNNALPLLRSITIHLIR